MSKTAGIVLIGNEILSGKILDANATHLCRELRGLGVEVRKISVIPDEIERIAEEVVQFARTFDYVFTSGGVGPTHDDVTIEGVSRALGVSVVRDPKLVAVLEHYYKGNLNTARLKMAEVPEGSELLASDSLIFPAIAIRNVYVLPGVPEIFRQKFEAIKERFREQPFYLRNVFLRLGEGTLADLLNDLLRAYPLLILGSYPEFSHPDYKVKVTLESKDQAYLDRALAAFVDGLPKDVVVKVE